MDLRPVRRLTEAPSIRTERLILRPYRLEDFDHLLALYGTERARFIGGNLRPRQVWDGFMNMTGQWPVFGFGGWAVEEAETGILVGEVAIHKPLNYPEVEIGWLLFDGHEGKGFALEMAEAALDFARTELKLPSLVSYIDAGNHRSIRLAECLGAVLHRDAETPNGEACLVYRHRVA